MTIENLKKASVLLLFIVAILAANNILLTKRITARVLDSIKRDYVPGPYEPGFDPDKVPPKSTKTS